MVTPEPQQPPTPYEDIQTAADLIVSHAHFEEEIQRARVRRQNVLAAGRAVLGFCPFCGRPTAHGKTYCGRSACLQHWRALEADAQEALTGFAEDGYLLNRIEGIPALTPQAESRIDTEAIPRWLRDIAAQLIITAITAGCVVYLLRAWLK